MTSFTGTAQEIAAQVAALGAAGADNISFWIPPQLTRKVILEVEEQIMPLVRQLAA
jgi:hypothetical protein